VKKLDRYVLRVFLSTFGIVFLFVLGIYVLISTFSKIDSVLDAKQVLSENGFSTVGVLARNYFVSIPFLFQKLAPFVAVIAATIAFVRLMRGNEITPMVAAGRSLHRICLPLYATAVVVFAGMLAVQEWAVPRLAEAWSYSEMLIQGNVTGRVKGLGGIRDGNGNVWTIARFYPRRMRMEDIQVLRLAVPGKDETGSLTVAAADWKADGPGGPGWYPENAIFKSSQPANPRILPSDKPLPTDLSPEPLGLAAARELREADKMLSLTEAARIARENRDVPRLTVSLHSLFTWPLGMLLLLFVGLPIVLRHREKNLFVGVGIALGLCGLWFALDTVFQDLGVRAVLPPAIAAWCPALIFSGLGIAVADSMR
jgi:lipopolysaccharide export system permease protein